MRTKLSHVLAVALCLPPAAAAATDAELLAPTGTLRAVYIAANLAQATRDPVSLRPAGVIVDITNELGRRLKVPVSVTAIDTAALVLDAVRLGDADIGFVAPNPERAGVVSYSQVYMLVQQSALVRDGSSLTSVREFDVEGRTIGVNTGDSVGVWLKGRLHNATLRTSGDYSLGEAAKWLHDGSVDAFAGNRQRLAAGTRGVPDLHLLPDNLYGVPQTIAVQLMHPAQLTLVNSALNEMRASGFLAAAMARSGADGIDVAPPAD